MKTQLYSALTALALVASTSAIPSPIPAHALQRRTDAPPLPPCPCYTPYTYVGCFKDGNPRALPYNPGLEFSTMTVETCTATCKANGFKYAGLEYYGECFCGTVLPEAAPAGECSYECNGDTSQTCGGFSRLSIWQDPTYPAVDLSNIVSEYAPLGCYTEGSPYRAVSFRQTLDALTLTTEKCLDACGHQYFSLAATEFAGECYCGYMLQGGSVKTLDSECNMACSGAPTEICGGPNRLNLYEAKILELTEPCSSSCVPPPPETCDGTAYGYSGAVAKTFVSLGIAKNWGWVLKGTPPITGPLYMGAGGNEISKATVVGEFTIEVKMGKLVVTYKTNAPWSLSSTHFYYGSTLPPKIAPGQFGNTHPLQPGTTTDSFTLPYDASKNIFIVHAGISYAC